MAAMQYKLEGNRLFSQKKYEEAIKQYSKAINKSASTSVFYTNRALCHIKLQRWEEVIADCKIALENDSQSVKAHFFMGQANVEFEKYDEAIWHLTRAHELAKQQKLNFGDDIAAVLRMARKKKWDKMEQVRITEEIELQSYLNDLIDKDRDRELEHRKEEMEALDKEELEKVTNVFDAKYDQKKQKLNSLFAQVDQRRKVRDVPDYMCGKISFEIMKNPVITPSGITYDRKDIEEHLQRVGHFDPVTRQELKLNQLIPNLAMQDVITHFIEENGWVEDY